MKYYFFTISFLISVSVKSQDLNLDKYLKIAEENNPAIQAEFRAYKADLEKINQVNTLPEPTLSLGYFVSSPETRFGPQQAKLGITQMFPTWGSLDAKEQQFAIQAKATYEKYLFSKKQLYFKVKKLWFELYLTKKSISVLNKQLQIFEGLLKQATSNFEHNNSGMINVLRFQMQRDEIINKITLLTDEKLAKEKVFNILINQDVNTEITRTDSLYYDATQEFSSDSISTNHNLIKGYDAKLKSAEYKIKTAKLNSYPRIGVGLDYVFVGKRPDMDFSENGKDIIMPMVSLSLPLWRKKYKAGVYESTFRSEQIDFEKQSVKNSLLTSYQKAILQRRTAFSNLELYKELLIKANQAVKIAETAYTTSGKDYSTVLELQNIILAYELKSAKAETELAIAVAQLEFLCGR